MNSFYCSINISKQAIHRLIDRRMQHNQECSLILNIVAKVRADHPTLSCRAMYYKINPISMGRDAFEDMCYQYGYKTEQVRSKHRTTDSSGVIRFENLTIGINLTAINQLFSSDITYFEINEKFYYITFVMDCFSRFILGYSVSSRLTTEQTTLPALTQAIKKRGNTIPENIILHSDGGGQYYDKEFLKLTNKYKMRNSMCEFAWENGKAERINGIIKNNYLKHYDIKSFAHLVEKVDLAVSLYNNDRPHKSLKYKTPKHYENIY